MTDRTVTHGSFTLERVYEAAPARVFDAFADPAVKARWFAGPEAFEQGDFQLDFRVGGQEVNSGGPPGGPLYTYRATYHEIVDDQRIVSSYTMDMDETRISVSVATFELIPERDGTRLILTEHGAFLDGNDTVQSREQGTARLLDALGAALVPVEA
jgi:uncharacterized protein YndB with AHSA1/START domain